MFQPYHKADWFYMETSPSTPQSITHEMLEMGIAKRKDYKAPTDRRINFLNFQLDRIEQKDKPIEVPLTTSYVRDYAAPYKSICPPKTILEDMPHLQFTRMPLNDFDLKRLTSSENKFMDDHLVDISPQKKNINFFRQIRNQHYPFI